MLTTKILAAATERKTFGGEVHLLLISGPDGWALEIQHGDTRHALPLLRRDLNDIAEAIHAMRPTRGEKRPTSRHIQFEDGTLTLQYDNRGEPYRDGLTFGFSSEANHDPQVFLETRDLDDFYARLVQILKTR